jgi:putative FmdB family regulatory protein
MPIYEYRCEVCGGLTSRLVLPATAETAPACRVCSSPQTQRVMSRFAHHRSEASRLAAFDPSVPRRSEYYQDSRNVGLWAKKRAQQLGVDLGSHFEETVEKARTGKILEDT